MVRLRVWTAWREQLCARGALREQHRGGRCVASPITIGRVPDLQRGSALPADAGGSDAWPCMQSVVDPRRECSCILLRVGRACGQVLGFGPRNRHGWMEELSTGFKEKGRVSVARYGIGYGWLSALCGAGVGGASPRDPIQVFYIFYGAISLLDLPSSGTSWQVRTTRRLPPTRAPCTSTLSLSSNVNEVFMEVLHVRCCP